MWVVRLSDKQLGVLKALVEAEERHGPTLARALESLELARWDDLPEAELPWGSSARSPRPEDLEADVVWDLAGGSVSSASSPAHGLRPHRRTLPDLTPRPRQGTQYV